MDDFEATVPMREGSPARVPVPRGMPPVVHPSAVIEPGAVLADDVRVGPCCVVSSAAVVGRGTVLESHVTLMGDVVLGDATTSIRMPSSAAIRRTSATAARRPAW